MTQADEIMELLRANDLSSSDYTLHVDDPIRIIKQLIEATQEMFPDYEAAWEAGYDSCRDDVHYQEECGDA